MTSQTLHPSPDASIRASGGLDWAAIFPKTFVSSFIQYKFGTSKQFHVRANLFMKELPRMAWKHWLMRNDNMASIRKEITVRASVEQAWGAMRDIGALHTRLVPGFVTDTQLDGDARIVTFANGSKVRERIVTNDDQARRLVWTATGELLSHHNGTAQIEEGVDGGARVIWTADFLPDAATPAVDDLMQHGMSVMQTTLNQLAVE
jgi:Polyketide cyclase / dehydrase and lipid transport